jgi:hypothetical protein
MKPPLHKFQQEIANALAGKFRKSQTVVVSIPTGHGRSIILAEVARLLEHPTVPFPEWDASAYQLAWQKYLSVKEVQECLEIGNEEAKKRRAFTRKKLERLKQAIRNKS